MKSLNSFWNTGRSACTTLPFVTLLILEQQTFVVSLTMLLTGILMMGLLRREKRGIASISFESFLIIVLYVACFALIALPG